MDYCIFDDPELAEEINTFLDEKGRKDLLQKIQLTLVGNKKLMFNLGVPIDMDVFMKPVEKVIYYFLVKHLMHLMVLMVMMHLTLVDRRHLRTLIAILQLLLPLRAMF